MAVIADRIAASVISAYDKLPKSGKPGIRSNGVTEWTVLSGIVAFDELNNRYEPISLGTGVKATPNEELQRSNGQIVHDCHAEVICLRAFNALLLKEICDLQNGQKSFLIEKSADGYKVKDVWKFAMYISRIPCGDASMNLLEAEDKSECENCQQVGNIFINGQYVHPEIDTIIRGRANYKLRKVVRTKPGRADSKITLSKSCSDKLTMKQMISICNALTWSLLQSPVYLEWIVLPKQYQYEQVQLEDTFWLRLKNQQFLPFKFLFCNETFSADRTNLSQQPSLSSCVSLYGSNEAVSEVILNGVKNGFYVKGKKPLRKGCQSIISRCAQWSAFKKIKAMPSDTDYYGFKSSVVDRNHIISKAKATLSASGWISTCRDNCI